MREERDMGCALRDDIFDGLLRRVELVLLGDVLFLVELDVEVNPDEHVLPLEISLFDIR